MIWRDRLLRRLAAIVVVFALFAPVLMSGLASINPFDPITDLKETFGDAATADDPVLTTDRLRHITDGDRRGGGHLYGTGAPCKSEFPASWSREKIARDIPLLAANDNIAWQPSRNGYVTAETRTADGLNIRIVVDPQDNEIVTAYPTNVKRNPCPANDN